MIIKDSIYTTTWGVVGEKPCNNGLGSLMEMLEKDCATGVTPPPITDPETQTHIHYEGIVLLREEKIVDADKERSLAIDFVKYLGGEKPKQYRKVTYSVDVDRKTVNESMTLDTLIEKLQNCRKNFPGDTPVTMMLKSKDGHLDGDPVEVALTGTMWYGQMGLRIVGEVAEL